MKAWQDLKKWTNCATSCEWGTLYLETYTGEPEQVFVNVCSQAGVKHVGGFFEIELEDSKPKYGWRMGLENYLDSEVFVDKKALISKVDLARMCGISKTRVNQLLKDGSLGDDVEGPYIIAESIETLVENHKESIKEGNQKKSENWVYRWIP